MGWDNNRSYLCVRVIRSLMLLCATMLLEVVRTSYESYPVMMLPAPATAISSKVHRSVSVSSWDPIAHAQPPLLLPRHITPHGADRVDQLLTSLSLV